MKSFKRALGLLAGGATAVGFYACSAKSTDPNDQGNPFQNGGGFANGSSWDASLGGGFANAPNGGGGSFGGGIVFGGQNGSGGSSRTTIDGCPVVHQKPEQVVVYKDATVTDTVYQSKPVALLIMQDRSSSMVGITGDPNSWPNSTAAITAFVNDPKTAGIDIALAAFPPITITGDPLQQGDCSAGSDCGTLVVPWGPLPQNGPAMIQGYNTASPNMNCPIVCLTPTECALRGMINDCLQYQQTHAEQCVAILVTDGSPTTCDTNTTNLVAIVADGHSKGITTYTLGLPGSNQGFLDQLAVAGGTGQSINVGGGAQDFINALNNIRQTIAVTTTTQVTTSTVLATPLPCLWTIPPVPAGTSFEKDKVNVQYTAPNSTTATDFGRVNDVGQCANVPPGQGAWYYDDNTNPTKLLACPSTCDGQLKNSAGASVDVLFGCDSHFIFH